MTHTRRTILTVLAGVVWVAIVIGWLVETERELERLEAEIACYRAEAEKPGEHDERWVTRPLSRPGR